MNEKPTTHNDLVDLVKRIEALPEIEREKAIEYWKVVLDEAEKEASKNGLEPPDWT